MPSSFNQDTELAEFFTDVEHLRGAFKESVAAPTLTKRLLVIWGVGGVGKSSLLRMFRLQCKGARVPVALASGDEAKSALDVLARWTEDLKDNGVALPSFGKTFEHYRAIQAKVDKQARKTSQQGSNRQHLVTLRQMLAARFDESELRTLCFDLGIDYADLPGASKSDKARELVAYLERHDRASELVETGKRLRKDIDWDDALAVSQKAPSGAAPGSIIPGIGAMVGALGGMGAEALVDWLCGFLEQPDIDLLLDPAKTLADDLLADVAPAADKRRIVLMLDTFEQMTALDDWARNVAQRLPANVLFVIAGRALPNWSRAWQSWMANAQVEELKPMTEDVMRDLVRRYYATMRGGEPNPEQVEAIIRFARGLPMVVTSAVQLLIEYDFKDFQSVKPRVVADLVDRLMEGVPNELIPALEAAAIVRWFDQPILRAITGLADVHDVYNELRRFPFVRVRAEGLALHDAVREIMDENLRAQDSERHCELHERAAAYFEKRLEKTTGEEAERLGLERLYHRVRADEEAGIKLFQEMAEELARYRLFSRLRALLNDANTYPLERENSKLWREYYNTRLADLQAKGISAEHGYEAIINNVLNDPRLEAYVLCDLGSISAGWQHLGKPEEVIKATRLLEKSLSLVPLDSHLVNSLFSFSHLYQYLGKWNESLAYLEKADQFYMAQGDNYGLVFTHSQRMVMYLHMGQFKETFDLEKETQALLTNIPRRSFVRAQANSFACTRLLLGRYAESEKLAREAMSITQDLGDRRSSLEPMRWLSWSLALQGKYEEANDLCAEHIRINRAMGDYYVKDMGHGMETWGIVLTQQGQFKEARTQLIQSLTIKQDIKETLWIPRTFVLLAVLCEVEKDWEAASRYYEKSLQMNKVNRRHDKSAALVGLCRTRYDLGAFASIPELAAQAEKLAQTYEFNDHLTSLRLTQAQTFDVSKDLEGLTALDYFKQAMVYALRYNRFLLDEVLSGRPQGTPLRPIIPYCLERGEDGQQMLTALRDWWKTGVNDIGTPRPDTISPIPEGIPLLEAERIAREREPGDGSPQESVVEQFEAALA